MLVCVCLESSYGGLLVFQWKNNCQRGGELGYVPKLLQWEWGLVRVQPQRWVLGCLGVALEAWAVVPR